LRERKFCLLLSHHFAKTALLLFQSKILNRKAHILHVDDDPDVRLLIAASLGELGYIVATAGTVEEALQLAKDLKFNLCILDLKLPDGTGVDLCRQLRKLQPGVPIAYYSAYADADTQRDALSVCGDAYFKKPITMDELDEAVSKLLGRGDKS
jgi:two-component system, NtrC family, response regulator PilR